MVRLWLGGLPGGHLMPVEILCVRIGGKTLSQSC